MIASIAVGLEPAHMHAEWRVRGDLRGREEFIGNAVSIIPPGEPHHTLWQRRADLIHIYLDKKLLWRYSNQVYMDGEVSIRFETKEEVSIATCC